MLTDDTGDTVILASQAELPADLTEGILTSARLVLNQQLQLAANQIMRVGGRYTALQTVAASSCKVCAGDPTPLWEIRARRVVHDEQERQIYFDNAQFRLAGVPVFYIPRLRMPDPTLDRATGFLMPTLRTTSDLGTGLKFPYFIILGPSADLTVTPYVTTQQQPDAGPALSSGLCHRADRAERCRHPRRPDAGQDAGLSVRWTAAFSLPLNFGLTLQAADRDRPGLSAGLRPWQHRPAGQPDRDQPHPAQRTYLGPDHQLSDPARGRRQHDHPIAGGGPDLSPPLLAGHPGRRRRLAAADPQPLSQLDQSRSMAPTATTSPMAATLAASRRGSTGARSFLLPVGIEATVLGEADGRCLHHRAKTRPLQGNTTRTHGSAGVELRWPLVKAEAGGAVHVIEPVVQLIWAVIRRRGPAERGFGAGRIRRGQPVLAEPVSRIGRGRTRPARQSWRQLDPARPGRLDRWA